tara:strand:- start:1489 stop:2127 length:639 start_codon:yes stop_codon:yes gene_type:complete
MNKETQLQNIGISKARLINNKDKKFKYDVNWSQLSFQDSISACLTLYHLSQMQHITVSSLNIQRNLKDLKMSETIIELLLWQIAHTKCPFLTVTAIKDIINTYDYDYSLAAISAMVSKLTKIKLLEKVLFKDLNEYQQEMTKEYKSPAYVYRTADKVLNFRDDLSNYKDSKINDAQVANPLGEILEKLEDFLLLCPPNVREQFATKIYPNDK